MRRPPESDYPPKGYVCPYCNEGEDEGEEGLREATVATSENRLEAHRGDEFAWCFATGVARGGWSNDVDVDKGRWICGECVLERL